MAEEQYRKSPWANWNWGERPRHWVIAGILLLLVWVAIAFVHYRLEIETRGNTWLQFMSGSWPNWDGISGSTFEASLAISTSFIINFVAPLGTTVAIIIAVLRATRRNVMSDAGLIASYSSMLETELVEGIYNKLYPEDPQDGPQRKKEVEKVVRETLYNFNEYWFTVQLPVLLDSPHLAETWSKAVKLRRGE